MDPMTPPTPDPTQPAGIGVQVNLIPTPGNIQIQRVMLNGIPNVVLVFVGPGHVLSSFFTPDEAKKLANMILQKATGVEIASADALQGLGGTPLDQMLRNAQGNGSAPNN